MRKTNIVLLAAMSMSLGLASCSSGPNAQTGTVLGALGGAAAGGIIGHQSGRGLEGAAIGGGLGALGGNMIGGAQDQRNYQRRADYERQQYYNNGPYNNGPYYNNRGPYYNNGY